MIELLHFATVLLFRDNILALFAKLMLNVVVVLTGALNNASCLLLSNTGGPQRCIHPPPHPPPTPPFLILCPPPLAPYHLQLFLSYRQVDGVELDLEVNTLTFFIVRLFVDFTFRLSIIKLLFLSIKIGFSP